MIKFTLNTNKLRSKWTIFLFKNLEFKLPYNILLSNNIILACCIDEMVTQLIRNTFYYVKVMSSIHTLFLMYQEGLKEILNCCTNIEGVKIKEVFYAICFICLL